MQFGKPQDDIALSHLPHYFPAFVVRECFWYRKERSRYRSDSMALLSYSRCIQVLKKHVRCTIDGSSTEDKTVKLPQESGKSCVHSPIAILPHEGPRPRDFVERQYSTISALADGLWVLAFPSHQISFVAIFGALTLCWTVVDLGVGSLKMASAQPKKKLQLVWEPSHALQNMES